MNIFARLSSLRRSASRRSVEHVEVARSPSMMSWSFVGSLSVHALALGGLTWWALEGAPSSHLPTAIIAVEQDSVAMIEPPAAPEPERVLEAELPPEPTLIETELPPPVEVDDDPPPREVVSDPREHFEQVLAAPWTIDATRRRSEIPTAVAEVATVAPPAPVEPAPAAEVREPVVTLARKLSTPEPSYPRMSRRLGEEGVVELRLQLGADGRVQDVKISQSSGFQRLDDAAVEAVRAWTFAPATRDGVAIESVFDHRFVFQLHAS